MNEDNALSGFSALFDSIGGQIDPANVGDLEVAGEDSDGVLDIDAIYNDADTNPFPTTEVEEAEENNEEQVEASDDNEETESTEAESTQDSDPTVIAFFDALAESAGWGDVTEDEKPKTVESLMEYMKAVVEENSKPTYSNEEVAALDEYVRNGGSIKDYVESAVGSVNYDSLDVSNEDVQRNVVRELLSKKGYSEAQITRKIEKYEDADILEDEANDAIESLKEMHEESKKALLEEQKNNHVKMVEEQQNFYNNVIGEIEALTDIRGIKIPKQDKQTLMEYIFKVETDGRTKYQKDYAKSTKNLIESAYFTMKGDSLLSSAKKSGETSAVEKLKHTLNSTKVSGSKQKIENRSAQPLWSVASSQLLRRPK